MIRYYKKIKNSIKVRYCIILWILVIIYAIFIFQLSSSHVSEQPKAIQETEQVINATVNKINKGTGGNIESEKSLPNIEHFFLYLGFGFLLFFAIYSLKRLNRKKLSVPIAGTFGFFYGITDEIHQYFISERDASINDVLVNGFGVIIGIAFAVGIIFIANHFRKNSKLTKKIPNKLEI